MGNTCKIFDPYPKDSREYFYDNEEVLNDVEKLLQGKFWPLILGPKRVGKTSIAKIVSKELNGVFVDASGIKSLKEFGNLLLNNLYVSRLQIDLKLFRIEIQKRPVTGIQNLLAKLDDTIIVIDEVQNITTPWFISVLSTAYNTSNVRFAFTGSMIGLSKILTGESKGKKISFQFKGRPIVKMEVSPFDDKKSEEFLKYGMRKCNIEINEEEIYDAVKTYRGIVGWLTYYGNFRSLGYSHEKAKEIVNEIAKSIIADEIKQFGELERAILKSLSMTKEINWTDLKKITESLTGRKIEDWSFNHALEQLIAARLVFKKNSEYSLIDPMYYLIKNIV